MTIPQKQEIVEATHTPGPWEWTWTHEGTAGFGASPELRGGGKRLLFADVAGLVSGVRICSEADGAEAKANARLIAASPDLLEALRFLLLVVKGAEMLLTGEAKGPRRLGEADHEFIRQAEAAVAKAEATR